MVLVVPCVHLMSPTPLLLVFSCVHSMSPTPLLSMARLSMTTTLHRLSYLQLYSMMYSYNLIHYIALVQLTANWQVSLM